MVQQVFGTIRDVEREHAGCGVPIQGRRAGLRSLKSLMPVSSVYRVRQSSYYLLPTPTPAYS
jgi:hypothetical protein